VALLAAVAGAGIPASVQAESRAASDPATAAVTPGAKPADQPKPPDLSTAQASRSEQAPSFKAAVRAMVEREVRTTGLPADIVEAVVYVESNYDPSTIGEIGLMQIRPQTAAMLGFTGTDEELAEPEVNIHYGVIYLRGGHDAALDRLLPAGAQPSCCTGFAVRDGGNAAAFYCCSSDG
jgi:soluble lytic murein transglycosylase-like protein